MNHLHDYSHLWQTVLPCLSYSFLSITLACDVTRSHDPGLLIVQPRDGHGLPAQIADKRRTLAVNHRVVHCIRENNEIIRKTINPIEKRRILHTEGRKNFRRVISVKNWHSLTLPSQERYLSLLCAINALTYTINSVTQLKNDVFLFFNYLITICFDIEHRVG
jgi:hypothetical protein